MSEITLCGTEPALEAFQHQAFLYAGTAAFLEGTVPFIEAGLSADEPVLVVVGAEKMERLEETLGADADRVSFADMALVGRNPARIIPAWWDFLARHGGAGPARGIGEPVYPERTPDELVECQRHEALLNVAFAGGPPWRLLCPYDTTALTPAVLEAALHSHRFVTADESPQESADYEGDAWDGAVDDKLSDPPGEPPHLFFGPGPLESVRHFVTEQAGGALRATELSDLIVAVVEVAGNSLVHGGGAGTLRLWTAGGGVVCEVRDRGWIREPLVGRTRPALSKERGRGLWMANQLCDLVQLRSSPAGTVIRLHMDRRPVASGK